MVVKNDFVGIVLNRHPKKSSAISLICFAEAQIEGVLDDQSMIKVNNKNI